MKRLFKMLAVSEVVMTEGERWMQQEGNGGDERTWLNWVTLWEISRISPEKSTSLALGSNLSLTGKAFRALGSGFVDYYHSGSVCTLNCVSECWGRQGSPAAPAWLTAICVVVSYSNRKWASEGQWLRTVQNIPPETNGCTQTYGFADEGDVFGIAAVINCAFKRKTEDTDSVFGISHQKPTCFKGMLYKANDEKGEYCKCESVHRM